FFFQAEDGIRDFHVTGVQTCALPIFFHRSFSQPIFAPTAATTPMIVVIKVMILPSGDMFITRFNAFWATVHALVAAVIPAVTPRTAIIVALYTFIAALAVRMNPAKPTTATPRVLTVSVFRSIHGITVPLIKLMTAVNAGSRALPSFSFRLS